MSKQRAPKGANIAVKTSEDQDSRFSNFTTDPRFRLPSKKHTRTTIDTRFSRMLKDDDFTNTAKVDRYGRKLSNTGKKKALERLYLPATNENADEGALVGDEERVEIEDDQVVARELKRANAGYDAARGGGFSSSDDENDAEDEDDDEDDGGVEITDEEASFPDLQAEQAAIEMGEVSPRFAVVNLDWDNIRAVDLMAVFSSFVPAGGRILKISIFPSEFGKERMEREELQGPPKEIFATKQQEVDDDESDSEDDEDVVDNREVVEDDDDDEIIRKQLQQEDEGKDFDGAALRQYQLERLRYYYAVVACSDNDTAQSIYNATDGTEYLSSANFFDLRFIPDGTEFENKPRDECDSVPSGYRPTDFVTDALQHSKVKLTWDMDPEEATRKDAIKRAFTGSRTEIGENDLRAYLGSDSEDEADEEYEEEDSKAKDQEGSKLTKKELQRQKMRAALGLSNESLNLKKNSGPIGDMEITFTAGLSAKENGSIFENEPIMDETTAEKYIRKEKERKARRKEKAKAVREGRDPEAVVHEVISDVEAKKNSKEDLGFDDPFFATNGETKQKASKSLRKADRLKKRAAKAAEAAAKESERTQLELLMSADVAEPAFHLDHFDINEIARAEKQKKKKSHRKDKIVEGGKRGGLQENFEIDVGDERFSKLFESHEFAIDPSNPRFKGTEAMKKLLAEGRRKRGVDADADGKEEDSRKGKKRKHKIDDGTKADLIDMVNMVKKKVKT